MVGFTRISGLGLELVALGAFAFLGAACASSTPAPVAANGASAPSATSAASAEHPKEESDTKLRASLAGPQRTDAERKRDAYRHPLETLEFFGLKDDMSVVELSPGGGWYTAVLAPVLRDHGKLEVAGGNPNGDPNSEGTKHAQQLIDRFQKMPQAFDKVHPIFFDQAKSFDLGAPESVDLVVTFRNVHNWVEDGVAEKVLAAAFKVLKHGGTLGVEEHRANAGAPTDAKTVGDTGYLPEDYVVKLVEGAGFKLAGTSEVNANPKDTKDHPKGVWTLPPNYALGETDHAKYEAMGESDRMTLKFTKP